jgi:hypothetical protein
LKVIGDHQSIPQSISLNGSSLSTTSESLQSIKIDSSSCELNAVEDF